MYDIGLAPVTGKRGTTPRLCEQLHRLFSTSIRWTDSDPLVGRSSGIGYTIAQRHDLWSSPHDPEQRPLWNSTVTLGAEFFQEVLRHSIPVDLRALRTLKGSPLSLDIYAWLTYRMSYLRRPCLIPWPALEAQFGAGYRRTRDFRRRFLQRLAAVLRVYSAARCVWTPTGLLLKASPTHVGPS